MTTIEVSGVCERDVDLLMLEEFVATRPFFEWFAEKIGVSLSSELLRVARSVTTSIGESDLELTVQDNQQTVRVLIENKVDAIFQPRQAERYCERAAGYLRDGACSSTLTVLVAPGDYFPDEEDTCGFDRRVTYEDMLAWFEDPSRDDPRIRYKRAILESAIARGGTGWQLVPNEEVTDFWKRYWQIANADAPELRMPRPDIKPTKSGFIRFKPAGLRQGVKLLHKVRYGNVDLQFAGMGERVGELEQRYRGRLEPGMFVEGAGKSAVVRVLVPRIDMSAPFGDTEAAVRKGLESALRLLELYRAEGAA